MKPGFFLVTSLALLLRSIEVLASGAVQFDAYQINYIKGAFCSVQGGACAASRDFESAYFQNPASLSVPGHGFDYDFDFGGGLMKENGRASTDEFENDEYLVAIGWAGARYSIGASASFELQNLATSVTSPAQGAVSMRTSNSVVQLHLPMAMHFQDETQSWDFGLAFNLLQILSSGRMSAGSPEPAVGLTIGARLQQNKTLSWGSWFKTAIQQTRTASDASLSIPPDVDLHQPMTFHWPWIWATGFALEPFSDASRFEFDLNVVGPTVDGEMWTGANFAPEAGPPGAQISKGRNITVEPRAGWQAPVPTVFNRSFSGNYFLGTYLEPKRCGDCVLIPHATGGLSYVFGPGFEFMLGIDLASDSDELFLTWR